ncbi:MAG TPA: hypothetical protein VGO40_21465 [Longimicrobium sp.]|jgi:hypothetical protein|nr:hypothetical protein [Longimicrobium sp.]
MWRFALLFALASAAACATSGHHSDPLLLIPSQAEVCDTLQTDRSGPAPRMPVVGAVARHDAALVGVAIDAQVGTALGGTMIRLSGRSTARALTDSLGGFSFQALPPGLYIIRGVRLDRRPVEVSASVARDRVTTVVLPLRLEACSMVRSGPDD